MQAEDRQTFGARIATIEPLLSAATVMAKVNPIELQKHLKGVDYPASKQELIKHAKAQGADQDICSILDQLPEKEAFETPAAVNKAIADFG